MILAFLVFAMAAVSGFLIYRLGRARRGAKPVAPGLVRLAAILACAWLSFSTLLFAWAAYRMMTR